MLPLPYLPKLKGSRGKVQGEELALARVNRICRAAYRVLLYVLVDMIVSDLVSTTSVCVVYLGFGEVVV
jgi:hypothetical protein